MLERERVEGTVIHPAEGVAVVGGCSFPRRLPEADEATGRSIHWRDITFGESQQPHVLQKVRHHSDVGEPDGVVVPSPDPERPLEDVQQGGAFHG